MTKKSAKYSRKEKGAAMTEYILIIALVAIGSIAVLTVFGDQIRAIFSASTSQLQGTDVDPENQGDTSGMVKKKLNDF